ncbi:MAG TPA: GAF domain-containing protein [Solirubrobacteraceae bacterium]|jgi:GAF domain-containing protein
MTTPADPLLQAIVEAAVSSVHAARGWLVAVGDGPPRVVAAAGTGTGDLIGAAIAESAETLGFVLAAGEALALVTDEDPRREVEVEGTDDVGAPTPRSAVVCVPCLGDGAVLGALELVDDREGRSFALDEIERATSLAAVAGVALGRDGDGAGVPAPGELAASVARLAERDPERYAAVARALGAMLANA